MNFSNYFEGNSTKIVALILALAIIFIARSSSSQQSIEPSQECYLPIEYLNLYEVPVATVADKKKSKLIEIRPNQTAQENIARQQAVIIQQNTQLEKMQKSTRKVLKELKRNRRKLDRLRARSKRRKSTKPKTTTGNVQLQPRPSP